MGFFFFKKVTSVTSILILKIEAHQCICIQLHETTRPKVRWSNLMNSFAFLTSSVKSPSLLCSLIRAVHVINSLIVLIPKLQTTRSRRPY